MYIMRTLIDIPEEDLSLLNRLGEIRNVSRAELVRQAISSYLAPHKLAERVDGFGLWANCPIDGLAYQERIRSEW